jgi:predicted DsbA family dithiol-disulfide isomerase
MTAKVRAQQVEALRLGISSTPTFMAGRIDSDGHVTLVKRVKGAAPYEMFKSVIDDILRVK